MTLRVTLTLAAIALSCTGRPRVAARGSGPTSADSALLSSAADSLEALERRIGMAGPQDRPPPHPRPACPDGGGAPPRAPPSPRGPQQEPHPDVGMSPPPRRA